VGAVSDPGTKTLDELVERGRKRYAKTLRWRERRSRKPRCEVIVYGRHATGPHPCDRVACGWLDGHRVCHAHIDEQRHRAVFTVEAAKRLRIERLERERLMIEPRAP
jgi:hypothetical protein